jgi:hypothetical protein
MPTPARLSWSHHPEFTAQDASPRRFILAKTKFRAYNSSCATFLDLVEDETCCADPSKPPCLRMRIGSRRETSLNIRPLNDKGKGRADDTVFADHVRYANSRIRMWPPLASQCPCSRKLHDILNPPLPGGPRNVTGVLDERTLVYMVKPARRYGAGDEECLGTVVVVDFTRPLDSASVAMERCDSQMDCEYDDDDKVACNERRQWTWSVGQERRCQRGTCS